MEWWYDLDADDRLAAVSPGWDAFALDNGTPGVLSRAVLGRSLWEFVSGVETEHLLRRIIGTVRGRGRAVEVPFRCDGPHVQRYMRFRAEPAGAGGLRITTRLLREVPTDGEAPATTRPTGEPEELIAMCSWCNRIRLADGTWAEVGEGVARLRLFERLSMPAITHGMCAGCLAAIEPELMDEADAERSMAHSADRR